MIVFCEEKERTGEEIVFDVFISSALIGTMSHKKGTGTWTVQNLLKSQWRTGDLVACCRDLFFPQSNEEIIFVDKNGKKIQLPE